MEGKICYQVVSILIDTTSNYSYISNDVIDKCGLNKEVHKGSWLVQLAICTKKIDHYWVRSCAFELNVVSTLLPLNILLLGSYVMLLGMDWLYIQKNKVEFNDMAI